MPTKRRQPKTRSRITPEAVRAYVAGDWMLLHMALQLRPWHESPLDVDGPEPPPHCDKACWAEVWALRSELERMRPLQGCKTR